MVAKDLALDRAPARVTGTIGRPELAGLDEMIARPAAVVAIIGQLILMFAMLIVNPLALFLRKPRPVNGGAGSGCGSRKGS